MVDVIAVVRGELIVAFIIKLKDTQEWREGR